MDISNQQLMDVLNQLIAGRFDDQDEFDRILEQAYPVDGSDKQQSPLEFLQENTPSIGGRTSSQVATAVANMLRAESKNYSLFDLLKQTFGLKHEPKKPRAHDSSIVKFLNALGGSRHEKAQGAFSYLFELFSSYQEKSEENTGGQDGKGPPPLPPGSQSGGSPNNPKEDEGSWISKITNISFLSKFLTPFTAAFIAVGAGVMLIKGMIDGIMSFTDGVQSRNASYGGVSGQMNFATTLRETYDELRKIRYGNASGGAAAFLTVQEEERKRQLDPLLTQLERFQNVVATFLEITLTDLLKSMGGTIDGIAKFLERFNNASLPDDHPFNLSVGEYLKVLDEKRKAAAMVPGSPIDAGFLEPGFGGVRVAPENNPDRFFN